MNEQYAKLQELKRIAWDIHDFDLFEFYNVLEYDLKHLRAIGKAVARVYRGGSDEAYGALFDALSDAGLLDD